MPHNASDLVKKYRPYPLYVGFGETPEEAMLDAATNAGVI